MAYQDEDDSGSDTESDWSHSIAQPRGLSDEGNPSESDDDESILGGDSHIACQAGGTCQHDQELGDTQQSTKSDHGTKVFPDGEHEGMTVDPNEHLRIWHDQGAGPASRSGIALLSTVGNLLEYEKSDPIGKDWTRVDRQRRAQATASTPFIHSYDKRGGPKIGWACNTSSVGGDIARWTSDPDAGSSTTWIRVRETADDSMYEGDLVALPNGDILVHSEGGKDV